MSTSVAVADTLVGGRYRLLRARALDSETGSGDLWRAHDEVLARAVAVRLLPASDPRVDALLAAAGRAGRVSDTGLARVLDASLGGPVAQEPAPDEAAGETTPRARTRRGNRGVTATTAATGAAHPATGAEGEAANGQPGETVGTFAYVVGEWVDGDSLGSLLRSTGPLDARQATTIVLAAARAVAAAHAHGLAHLHLHPDNVIVTRAGEVKVTDLEVAAALAGSTANDPRAVDARWLGRLLYAALTARWPRTLDAADPTEAALAGSARPGLPPAPMTDGHPASPRQVRAGVPRDVDLVVDRCLSPLPRRGQDPLRTPAAVAAALAALPQTKPEADVADPREAAGYPGVEPSRARRLLRIVVPLSLVLAIGTIGWLAGLAVGRVPGPGRSFSSSATNAPSPGSTAGRPVIAFPPGAVKDFDPEGDHSENPDQVPLATDGDPSTSWQTAAYKHRPDFGGLKSGVGLLVDLGQRRSVSSVSVLLTDPGATLELRVANTRSASAGGYQTVAAATDAGARPSRGSPPGTVVLKPAAGGPAAGRYWLIWITRLPKVGSTYSDGIAELTFHR